MGWTHDAVLEQIDQVEDKVPVEILLHQLLGVLVYKHLEGLGDLAVADVSKKKGISLRQCLLSAQCHKTKDYNLRISLDVMIPHLHEFLFALIDVSKVINHPR